MNYPLYQNSGTTSHNRLLLAGMLVLLACAFRTVAPLPIQKITAPATAAAIIPPPGNSVFLMGHAVGTQGYVCLPTSTGASWTIYGSRPEATLFSTTAGHDVQIISHFLSPDSSPNEFAPKPVPFGSATWQSSVDSSKVWAQSLHSIAAGSDASCPNTGAISCLLLQSTGSEAGPAGGKIMTGTSFIRRLNTQGGSARATGCPAATDVGKLALVPYTADYHIFRADE